MLRIRKSFMISVVYLVVVLLSQAFAASSVQAQTQPMFCPDV